MKTLIFLLSASILFSSCFSYRTMNLSKDKIVVDKMYKIKLREQKKMKVIISKIDSSSIAYIKVGFYKDKEIEEILLFEIEDIRERRFSYVKTGGIIAFVLLR